MGAADFHCSSVPGATATLSSRWLSRTHQGQVSGVGSGHGLEMGGGGGQKALLDAPRTQILTDVGCLSQSLAALGGQGLSSTPAGRHRLAGQRPWPTDPAKNVGNKATSKHS